MNTKETPKKGKKAVFLFEITAHYNDSLLEENVKEFTKYVKQFVNGANGGAVWNFHGNITMKRVQ